MSIYDYDFGGGQRDYDYNNEGDGGGNPVDLLCPYLNTISGCSLGWGYNSPSYPSIWLIAS